MRLRRKRDTVLAAKALAERTSIASGCDDHNPDESDRGGSKDRLKGGRAALRSCRTPRYCGVRQANLYRFGVVAAEDPIKERIDSAIAVAAGGS
jgi:hypothetical protein